MMDNDYLRGLSPLVSALFRSRKRTTQIIGTRFFALSSRFCFVFRLFGLGTAGRLVFLLLLPGDFPLPLLEGKFCSCHAVHPLPFVRSAIAENKKKAPRRDSLTPGRLIGHDVKLHGLYVFRCRAFLALCNIETDTLALG